MKKLFKGFQKQFVKIALQASGNIIFEIVLGIISKFRGVFTQFLVMSSDCK